MKLLLINTCGSEGVAALALGSAVVGSEPLPGRGTSECLMPAIRKLFTESGWRVADLTAVAVVDGPGSFTGVRVGLSAAKGLCEAGGVGMIAMSRLALVAAQVEGESVALLDAGRGEYYCGVYQSGIRMSEELLKGDEVRTLLASSAGVTCEARVAGALNIQLVAEPGAATMLRMATKRIAVGAWTDIALADANYLRRTDAELLNRTAKVPGGPNDERIDDSAGNRERPGGGGAAGT